MQRVEPTDAARPVILVVDDTPEALRFLTTTIESAGMTVLIAIDGLAALALLKNITPDLILMDAVMPNLDGSRRPCGSRPSRRSSICRSSS